MKAERIIACLLIAEGILAILMGFWLVHESFAYPLIGRCDADRNGVINSADLGRIAQGWGLAGETDVNVDGTTNSIDLAWCGRAFLQWEFADGVPYDDTIELPTVTTEGLSLEEASATAQAGICPECQPPATAPVPTP